MQKEAQSSSPSVKIHVSFPEDVWHGLTALAGVNKAKGKKGDSLSALLAVLGEKQLRKPESIAALRAVGSRFADHFASK